MRQVASDNATRAYNTSMAENANDRLALDKAKFAWQQTMDKAGLTGKFEDNWTMPTQQWFTGQFGTWNPAGPTPGQETMAREAQTYGQQMGYGQMYGQYFAPGTAPTAGQQTQAAQQQAYNQAATAAGLTGWFAPPGTTGQGTQTLAGQQQQFAQGLQTQQEQRAAQAQQQSQTQAYLQMLANLRGPADWYKYQQVLGSTPGGMRDLYAAAMGQYVPGGGATTGMQPQAASLQSMQAQIGGYPYAGQGTGQLMQPSVYQYNPSIYGQATYGQQPQAQQAQPPGYLPNVYPQQQQGSGQTWGSGIGIGTQETTPAQQQQATGNGTNMYGNMPAPNQVAAQSWKNLAPSQQQMMLGQWESQGWDKGDVQALMNQALPKYGSNAPTAGTWRMQ